MCVYPASISTKCVFVCVCVCVCVHMCLCACTCVCVCVNACGCGEFISPAHCLLNSLHSSEGQLFPLSSCLPLQLSFFLSLHPLSLRLALPLSLSLSLSLSLWLASLSIRQCSSQQHPPHPVLPPPHSSSKEPLQEEQKYALPKNLPATDTIISLWLALPFLSLSLSLYIVSFCLCLLDIPSPRKNTYMVYSALNVYEKSVSELIRM